jgi:hypothetical protein
MNTTKQLAFVAGGIALLTASSQASFAVVGANGGDGDAWEQYVAADAFNQSVRLDMGNSYGSGGLFSRETFTFQGEEYIKLCFATADHVVRNKTLSDITFAGASAPVTLSGAGWTTQIHLGGYDGNDDLAFVGMRAKRSDISATTLTFLDNLAPLALATPDTSDVTNYGFGTSANYTRDGNNDIDGFFWRPNFEDFAVSRGYTNHRFVNSDVTAVESFAYSIYDFEAIKWNVSNATTFGGINQGDSGGVIYQNGKFVGVNSFNTFIEGNDAQGLFRIYELGSLQGGNAFTQDNIDWLGDHCAELEAVPEPGTIIALAGLSLAAAAKRRKR